MGYWEEKKKYEQEIMTNKNSLKAVTVGLLRTSTCTWCGVPLDLESKSPKWFVCQNHVHLFGKGAIICNKCAKKCKGCKRYYCPKHIDKHKCIV